MIPGQTISLGRLTFGPKVSCNLGREDSTVITPHVTITGIWDFDEAKIVNITTGLATGSSDVSRARVEGGLSACLANSVSISGAGFYDGIGAHDLEIYGGSLKVTVPLN